jgi:hypothetical protein
MLNVHDCNICKVVTLCIWRLTAWIPAAAIESCFVNTLSVCSKNLTNMAAMLNENGFISYDSTFTIFVDNFIFHQPSNSLVYYAVLLQDFGSGFFCTKEIFPSFGPKLVCHASSTISAVTFCAGDLNELRRLTFITCIIVHDRFDTCHDADLDPLFRQVIVGTSLFSRQKPPRSFHCFGVFLPSTALI